jgi:hypothetical protein
MKEKRPLKCRFYTDTRCDGEFHSTKTIFVKWGYKEAKKKLVEMAKDFGGDNYEISTHMYEYGPGSDGTFSLSLTVESRNGEVQKRFVYEMDHYPW